LEIRVDSQTGPILTTITIPNTGGWKSWKVVSAPFTEKVKGVKDIYCLFKGNGKNLYNLNWLRFSAKDVPSSIKKHPLESVGGITIEKVNQNSNKETADERGRRLRNIGIGKKLNLPLGHILAIKSGNGKYLTIEGQTIKATADTVGEKEKFVALSENGDVVAIKSMHTNKFFSARLNQEGIPVIASHSGKAKDWEKFTWKKIGNVQFTLTAKNGDLVQVSGENQNSLTASKGSKLSIKSILVFEIIK